MTTQSRGQMAPAEAVHRYWLAERSDDAARWFEQFDLGEPSCYACGWYADAVNPRAKPFDKLERSHLIDHALGGSPGNDNLVLLCKPCNRVMPMFHPGRVDEAIAWIKARRSWFEAGKPEAENLARQIVAAGEPPAWLVRTLSVQHPEQVAALYQYTANYRSAMAAKTGELFPGL